MDVVGCICTCICSLIPTLQPLFRLTFGMTNMIPNKTIVTHTGLNILADGKNIPSEMDDTAAQLRKYAAAGYGRAGSPLHLVARGASQSHSPERRAVTGTPGSPRRTKGFFLPTLILRQFTLYGEKRGARAPRPAPVPATTEPPLEEGPPLVAVVVAKEEPVTILSPSAIVGGNLTTISSRNSSRNSSSESSFYSESSDDDFDVVDPSRRFSRASWMYYVDNSRCNGLVDDALNSKFHSLVAAHIAESGSRRRAAMREAALPAPLIETLVRYSAARLKVSWPDLLWSSPVSLVMNASFLLSWNVAGVDIELAPTCSPLSIITWKG